MSAEAVNKALKNLIRSIPSDKASIFAHPISWASYDSGRAQMAGKIIAWVKKKVGSSSESKDACLLVVRGTAYWAL